MSGKRDPRTFHWCRSGNYNRKEKGQRRRPGDLIHAEQEFKSKILKVSLFRLKDRILVHRGSSQGRLQACLHSFWPPVGHPISFCN